MSTVTQSMKRIKRTGRVVEATEKERVVFTVFGTANGTSLKGEIDIAYSRLIEVFGEPNAEGDPWKTDAKWEVLTPAGIATIYNYKTGKNYLGAAGQPTEEIRDWHIGGHHKEVVDYIRKALAI